MRVRVSSLSSVFCLFTDMFFCCEIDVVPEGDSEGCYSGARYGDGEKVDGEECDVLNCTYYFID